MELVQYGFYKVKDQYFSDFPNKRHMYNKSENRPYYLKAKISKDESTFGECITAHIIKFMNEERAVLIGNMIPITEDYIKGEFTITEHHYIVKDRNAIKAIKKRASRYLSLVKAGKMRPAVDILKIEKQLRENMK